METMNLEHKIDFTKAFDIYFMQLFSLVQPQNNKKYQINDKKSNNKKNRY